MRTILFFMLLLVCGMLHAQGQTGVIKVRKKVTKVMCLNGYTDGAIPPHAICGGKGLYVTNSNQYQVKSFVILVESYKTIEVKMNSNVVAGDICETLSTLKSNDVIYINKIVAIDNNTGREVNMPSLKFQVSSLRYDDKKQRYQNLYNEDNY